MKQTSLVIVFLAALLLAACGGGAAPANTGSSSRAEAAAPDPVEAAPAGPQWTSTQVIDAFRAAGLEVGEPRPMTKEDYGQAPYASVEGSRFFIPSLGEGKGGRIVSFDDPAKRDRLRDYYVKLGEASAALYSWVFVHDNIVVQINGNLPEETAKKYEVALMGME